MNPPEEIKIELSRTKVLLLGAGALLAVALGGWFLTLDQSELRAFGPFGRPALLYSAGLASVLFFGWCGLIAFKKLFDPKPGLVFTESGLTDNSSGLSAGFIPWSEITGIEVYEVQGQKSLIVLVTHPERYLEIGGPVKRWFTRATFNMCGSPIAIPASTLRVPFEELHQLFATQLSRRGLDALSAERHG